jgi:hypothetical protein
LRGERRACARSGRCTITVRRWVIWIIGVAQGVTGVSKTNVAGVAAECPLERRSEHRNWGLLRGREAGTPGRHGRASLSSRRTQPTPRSSSPKRSVRAVTQHRVPLEARVFAAALVARTRLARWTRRAGIVALAAVTVPVVLVTITGVAALVYLLNVL